MLKLVLVLIFILGITWCLFMLKGLSVIKGKRTGYVYEWNVRVTFRSYFIMALEKGEGDKVSFYIGVGTIK